MELRLLLEVVLPGFKLWGAGFNAASMFCVLAM